MNHLARVLSIVMLIPAVVLSGCKPANDQQQSRAGFERPEDVMTEIALALFDEDYSRYGRCFITDTPEKQKGLDASIQYIRITQSMRQFLIKGAEKYGIEEFVDSLGMIALLVQEFDNLPSPADLVTMATMGDMTIDGEAATLTYHEKTSDGSAGTKATMHFQKVDGRWYAADLVAPDAATSERAAIALPAIESFFADASTVLDAASDLEDFRTRFDPLRRNLFDALTQASMNAKSGTMVTDTPSADPAVAEQIVRAIRADDLLAVTAYLEGGGSPDIRDKDENTLLFTAVSEGRLQLVALLLAHDASVDLRSDSLFQRPPLFAITQAPNKDVAVAMLQQLLDAGADLYAVDAFTLTVMDAALQRGNTEAADVLQTAGYDMTHVNGMGQTPLDYAVMMELAEMVGYALRSGADPNRASRFGLTPLMLCADHETPAIAQALIAAGADVNARDERKATVLINAAYAGNVPMVTALLQAGADINARDVNDKTALDWAVAEQHEEVAALLRQHIENGNN